MKMISFLLPLVALLFASSASSAADQQHRSVNVQNHVDRGQAFILVVSNNDRHDDHHHHPHLRKNATAAATTDLPLVIWLGRPSYLKDEKNEEVESLVCPCLILDAFHKNFAAMNYAVMWDGKADNGGGLYDVFFKSLKSKTAANALPQFRFQDSGDELLSGGNAEREYRWVTQDNAYATEMKEYIEAELTPDTFEKLWEHLVVVNGDDDDNGGSSSRRSKSAAMQTQ